MSYNNDGYGSGDRQGYGNNSYGGGRQNEYQQSNDNDSYGGGGRQNEYQQGGNNNNYHRSEGQNVGNFMTDRNSSRVMAPPGGASTIQFG